MGKMVVVRRRLGTGVVGSGGKRVLRRRSGRREDGSISTATAFEERFLELRDLLAKGDVLVLRAAELRADSIDEPVTFGDIALERSNVLCANVSMGSVGDRAKCTCPFS